METAFVDKGVSETVLDHADARVVVRELGDGKRLIFVDKKNPEYFVRSNNLETAYSLDLLRKMLDVIGPGWLCEHIARDECSGDMQLSIRLCLFSYVSEDDFKHKRILDFGCGAGASTAILGRMFPESEIVGVDINPDFLKVAEARASFYGLKNVAFRQSPKGSSLPPGMGQFDYICSGGVYEHLLPDERRPIMAQLWSTLTPGGILFLFSIPNRHFPIEVHTTYLPLVNYLPDRLALLACRHLSKTVQRNEDWARLLRRGIRGGTKSEILGRLEALSGKAILLNPSRLGIHDRVELWYRRSTDAGRVTRATTLLFLAAKALGSVSGAELVPWVNLAIRKEA